MLKIGYSTIYVVYIVYYWIGCGAVALGFGAS